MLDKLLSTALTAASHLKEQPTSMVAESEPVPNFVYPGDTTCVFYDDENFGGEYITFALAYGTDFLKFNLHDAGWADKMASWTCGKDIYYDICVDLDSSCDYGSGVQGAGTIFNRKTGYVDQASELRMWRYDYKSTAAVVTFQDRDCSHDSSRYFADPNPGMKA